MTPNAEAIKELEAIVNGWIRKSVAEQNGKTEG